MARPGNYPLDGIVVPAGRTADHVQCAVELGADLGVPTVLMSSHESSPREAADLADGVKGADCTVLDLGQPVAAHPSGQGGSRASWLGEGAPDFTTAKFHEAIVGSRDDLPFKRNLGLVLARLAGWRAVLFLDDDIVDLKPHRVLRAVGALEHCGAVGIRAVDFPDNSVVCHAHRLAGGRQGVFVSGSVLLVRVDRADSFFPETYNEDWVYLIPHLERKEVAACGTARQRPFNPFRWRFRASAEEFGDVLGEGLVGSLHHGSSDSTLAPSYWRWFLTLRARFIDRTLRRCRASDDPRVTAVVPALEAAATQRSGIAPELLSDYVAAWKSDLRAWRTYLRGIQPVGDLESALRRLDLPVTFSRTASELSRC